MKARTVCGGMIVGLAFVGCGGPPAIVPALPPGVSLDRVTPEPREDADAVGESPARQASKLPPKSPELRADLGDASGTPPTAPPTEVGKPRTAESGLKYETLQPGSGLDARRGMWVNVHYVGKLADGTEFDSSRSRGRPSLIKLDEEHAIRGWVEGLDGIKVGERRKLTIPPDLGYGAAGRAPKIPPNAILVFEVELVAIKGATPD